MRSTDTSEISQLTAHNVSVLRGTTRATSIGETQCDFKKGGSPTLAACKWAVVGSSSGQIRHGDKHLTPMRPTGVPDASKERTECRRIAVTANTHAQLPRAGAAMDGASAHAVGVAAPMAGVQAARGPRQALAQLWPAHL
jgi:hypothetical protein